MSDSSGAGEKKTTRAREIDVSAGDPGWTHSSWVDADGLRDESHLPSTEDALKDTASGVGSRTTVPPVQYPPSVALLQNLAKSEGQHGPAQANNSAVVGLMLGIAALFLSWLWVVPLLAIVFGGIGLLRASALEGRGQLQALIGLVLGILSGIVYLTYFRCLT